MMIRLTDEAMEAMFEASHRDNGRKEIFRDIAKAQLKKVVEYITDTMHDNDFSCVVYFHPGKKHRDWKGRWVVGNLTGIDNDLICVKRCADREDEKRHLSPEGDNIIDALDKAVALLGEGE